MSEQSKAIAAILLKLPASERAAARDMIDTALKLGWHTIGLWEWLPGATMNRRDLVGCKPDDSFDFLPDPGE